MSYRALYERSIHERDTYWAEQASRIHWHRPFDTVCDVSNPPFVKWFDGGLTNLCHNAVDRHVHDRADQAALVFVSTETHTEETISYGQLLVEVERMAAILHGLGVGKGDRVLIYMPMIPQAVIAMLATVRLGAIHSVVFGGFASHALASRIDDATPSVIVTADAGSRGGKVIPYKPLLDEALRQSAHRVPHVLLVDRKLAPAEMDTPRDVDYWDARSSVMDAIVPCEWVEATHPSYTLYTSGTTGKPKGVQRDTGGYAVALAASMEQVYCGKPGETFFCASDIGWVVGHSYIVYGPLLTGMTTIIYEGLPIRPDAAIWWSLVEKYKVNVMFSAPTAIRVLKKQDPDCLKRHDLSSLKQLFLAGEPLDEPTAKWIGDAIGKPIIDNYWQTETGWPILSLARGVDPTLTPRLGSPGFPMPGYQVKLLDDQTGEELTGANQKGVLTIEGPLPPGCLQTIWGDDQRFVQTYWSTFPRQTGLQHLRLGHPRCGRLLLHPGPHRRRDQRGRPPPGHPRDRRGHQQTQRRGRGGCGGRGRSTSRARWPRPSWCRVTPAAWWTTKPARRWKPRSCTRSTSNWVRWPARHGCTSSTCCPRPARASCCAGPSRPCARAVTRVT
jgi:propionyl-CoA synthetase